MVTTKLQPGSKIVHNMKALANLDKASFTISISKLVYLHLQNCAGLSKPVLAFHFRKLTHLPGQNCRGLPLWSRISLPGKQAVNLLHAVSIIPELARAAVPRKQVKEVDVPKLVDALQLHADTVPVVAPATPPNHSSHIRHGHSFVSAPGCHPVSLMDQALAS